MTQPPHAPLGELVPEVGDVVGEDPVAALGVVLVQFPEHPIRCASSASRALTGCFSHL